MEVIELQGAAYEVGGQIAVHLAVEVRKSRCCVESYRRRSPP